MSELKKTPVGLSNGGTITGDLEIDSADGSALLVKKTGSTGGCTATIQAPAEAALVINSGVTGGSQPASVKFLENNSQAASITMDGSDANILKIGTGSGGITIQKSIQIPQTGGIILPRLTTTERDAIVSPSAGTFIYNTTTNKLNIFTTGWEVIVSA